MNIVETERVLHQGIQQGEVMWTMYAATIWGLTAVVVGTLAKEGWNAIQDKRRVNFVNRSLEEASKLNRVLSKEELSGLLAKVPISHYHGKTAGLINDAITRMKTGTSG